MMPRWWRELRNPALKCERLGCHDIRPHLMTGWCLPTEATGLQALRWRLDGAVAIAVRVTFLVCRRCKFDDKVNRHIELLHPVHRLGLPAEDWEELRRSGYFLRRS